MSLRLDAIQVQLDSSLAGKTSWAFAPEPGPPEMALVWENASEPARLVGSKGIQQEWKDALAALRWLDRQRCPGKRWIGFLSYDLGRHFENLPTRAADDLRLPLFVFSLHSSRGDAGQQSCVATYGRECPPYAVPAANIEQCSTFTRPEYLNAVRRAVEYIAAGDIFQVNLSQRFTLPQPAAAQEIYLRLQLLAPASYGAWLDYGDFALICNSPELFLRVIPDPRTGKRRVITRPIKGTRPRGPGMEAELRESIKDQAELNMIIDLERNDLGRVCDIGSVRVTQPRTIEAHPTVCHGVATVEGTLRDDVSFLDLLRATFPGGSITGAPKIRAMEIIEELEGVRRGPYCGAIGYLAGDGSMEFNIAIRTMIACKGKIHVPVGGGIVADSDPDAEYEETLVKARAMFSALESEK